MCFPNISCSHILQTSSRTVFWIIYNFTRNLNFQVILFSATMARILSGQKIQMKWRSYGKQDIMCGTLHSLWDQDLWYKLAFYVKFIKYCLIHEQNCFIPDKTRTASLLKGFKNEPFIDVNILKIDLVWAVKSSKKFIENSIKNGFLLFYLRELLMSFWNFFIFNGLFLYLCINQWAPYI